jgi:hypothetical protein
VKKFVKFSKVPLLIAVLWVLSLLLVAPLLVAPGQAQGIPKSPFDWIVAKKLTVQQGGAEFQSDVTMTQDLAVTGDVTANDVTASGDFALTGDITANDITASGNLTLTGNIANRSLFLRYQDIAAAPDIYAEAGVVSTTTSITTSILGIETPRNAVVTWQTVTTATAGNITVAGVDARGSSTTELIAVGAVSGTQTLTGVVPWASVTSFTLPSRTEAVTLTVKGGQKFGLPVIPPAAADVYHVTVNETPQAAPTVNTTYGTFDPVSTPAADVDYNVWMKQ